MPAPRRERKSAHKNPNVLSSIKASLARISAAQEKVRKRKRSNIQFMLRMATEENQESVPRKSEGSSGGHVSESFLNSEDAYQVLRPKAIKVNRNSILPPAAYRCQEEKAFACDG
jgi:hypothetical protein